MNSKSLINKIKSQYIIKEIFSYIKDKRYELLLFFYSKKYQKIFDLALKIKEEYIKKIEFILDYYIYIEPNYFFINALKEDFDCFLEEKKLIKSNINNIIYNIYENKEIKGIDEEEVDEEDKI